MDPDEAVSRLLSQGPHLMLLPFSSPFRVQARPLLQGVCVPDWIGWVCAGEFAITRWRSARTSESSQWTSTSLPPMSSRWDPRPQLWFAMFPIVPSHVMWYCSMCETPGTRLPFLIVQMSSDYAVSGFMPVCRWNFGFRRCKIASIGKVRITAVVFT
jgi:hypothetical protein